MTGTAWGKLPRLGLGSRTCGRAAWTGDLGRPRAKAGRRVAVAATPGAGRGAAGWPGSGSSPQV
jgi:hypothetical protein